ncbi:protein NKG7-like [Emydura macquarii macquarii]|uniref:protein NKG7-like n=1 Tax=Emydura macquarii macquarii TaxID=1129001 RepID=UPI003529EB00
MASLRIPSAGLALLSLLLLLVALASDHWLEARRDDVFIRSGLWRICVNSLCVVPSKLPDYIEATRMFLMLGLLAGLLSGFSLLASLSGSSSDSGSLLMVSAVGSFSAGFCIMVAMAVFTSEFAEVIKATRITFGWSLAIGWASIPFFLLTGGVTLLAQDSSSI